MLKNAILGEFFPNSSMVKINHSFGSYIDIATKLQETKSLGISYEKHKNNSTQLFEVEPLSTVEHEVDHFRLFISTPFGLLVWRIFQCIRVNYLFIDRNLSPCKKYNDITFPYADWLSEHLIELEEDFDEDLDKWHYIVAIMNENLYYEAFLSLLLGNRDTSIKNFLEIANISCQLLANRSDLDCNIKWSTKLPLDKNLSAFIPHVNTVELIEASARGRELIILEQSNIFTEERLAQWVNSHLHGVYEKGVKWLIKELGSASLSKIVIDIAFSSPIDIAGHLNDTTLYLEDILPTYRIHKIIPILQQEILNGGKDLLYSDMVEIIANKISIPLPREVYSNLSISLFWGNAYWEGKFESKHMNDLDQDSKNVIIDMMGSKRYYDYIESLFKSNFSRRLEQFDFFVQPRSDQIIAPMLTFYNDRVIFKFHDQSASGKDNMLLILHSYSVFCDHSMVLSILSDSSICGLKEMDILMQEEIEFMKLGGNEKYWVHIFNRYFSATVNLQRYSPQLQKALRERMLK